jgi:hypothetical protein
MRTSDELNGSFNLSVPSIEKNHSDESHVGARRHLTTDQRSGHALSTLLGGPGKAAAQRFLHVDGCADEADHINVGSGKDLTVNELARLVLEVVDFNGAKVHYAS